MKRIAIIAVAYNRVKSLQRLLDSLKNAYYENDSPTLIISIDKSEINEVEQFADAFNWINKNKIVDKHSVNLGLRPHMMSLRKWFDSFDALVVLEDDIVVSKNFYYYVRQCVDKYYEDKNVAGISLYNFEFNYQTEKPFHPFKDENDAYFMQCAMSWGEVWMKSSWQLFFDWYKQNEAFPPTKELPKRILGWGKNSWLKYHTRYCVERNLYFVYPYISLSTNFGDAGVHSLLSYRSAYQTTLQNGSKKKYFLPDLDCGVKYDVYFENSALYTILSLSKDNCCLDLQGGNNNELNKRFWLTTKRLNYKIVRSFSLQLRPIEENIFFNLEGFGIFLYDTTITERNPIHHVNNSFLYSYYIDDILNFIRKYGITILLKDIFKRITNHLL